MGFGQELIGSQVCLTNLPREQRVGLAFIALASLLSFLAIVTFFSLYLRNLFRSIRSSTDGSWKFFSTDIDSYFLSLMLADGLLSVGGLMNIKWIIEQRTQCGHYCSAQGAIQQLGAPGVALSNIAISFHTFFVIFYNWNSKSWIVPTVVNFLLWAYLLLLVFIGWTIHQSPEFQFFSPTPYWCWIDKKFLVERLIGDYVYPWLASLLLLLVYGLLFLRLRGWVVVNPDRWSRVRLVKRASSNRLAQGEFGRQRGDSGESEIGTTVGRREASKMLWYPLCYIILVLPMSVVRWIHFTNDGNPPPFIATATVATLFKLSGLVNVVLYMLTRPNLLLFRGQSSSRGQGAPNSPPDTGRLPELQLNTGEVFEFQPIPTASPDLYSASTYGSFAAMQLRPPTPQKDVEELDVPRQHFVPLIINIPSSRLSNLSGVWERVHKEGLSRSSTPKLESLRSHDDLLHTPSQLRVNEAGYVAIQREEAPAQERRPQSRPSLPYPSSRHMRSSDATQPRIHSFSPAWEETVRDILNRDNGAKAAFVFSARSSNIRTSTIERVQLGRASKGKKNDVEQWTFPAQSPQFHLTFQGAHPRQSFHPLVSSTSDEPPERGFRAPSPAMYHLPTRAQKRPASPQPLHSQRSVVPPTSFRSPYPQEAASLGTSEQTSPFTPVSSSLSAIRSPAFSSPRTTYSSFTSASPTQDAFPPQKSSPETFLLATPIATVSKQKPHHSRQHAVSADTDFFATDLGARDSRSRASALRKGRKASKVTFDLAD